MNINNPDKNYVTENGDSWFRALFGFDESYSASGDESELHVIDTHRVFPVGKWSTPTLAELRVRCREALAALPPSARRPLSFRHATVGDVLPMHGAHPGALFQAASQANCRETLGRDRMPEHGTENIASMRGSQGQACALACATGAVFRTYFAPVETLDGVQIGQTSQHQINCLDALAAAVDNDSNEYWTVQNGYLLTTERGASEFAALLGSGTVDRDTLVSRVKIGFLENVPICFVSRRPFLTAADPDSNLRVSQTFCTALRLPDGAAPKQYQALARLILDAVYESTLRAAVCSGIRDVFLCLVGGGFFGNPDPWISASIGRALALLTLEKAPLNVRIGHYARFDAEIIDCVQASFHETLAAAGSRDRVVGDGIGVRPRFWIEEEELQVDYTRPIGSGGFAEVFKGVYLEHTEVAVKKLHGSGQDPETRRLFDAEMKVWGLLAPHPNIVPLLGYHVSPTFFVTKWYAGGTLADYLRSLDWDIATIPPLLYDVAVGMMFLHSRDIIHSDLNASNILVDTAGPRATALIANFGLAKARSRVRETTFGVGGGSASTYEGIGGSTLPFAPPEFHVGNPMRKPSDVWMFGMLMWQLYAGGQTPYSWLGHWQAITPAIISGRLPPRPAKMPDGMWEIVGQCWAREMVDRPVFGTLAAMLRIVGGYQPVQTHDVE